MVLVFRLQFFFQNFAFLWEHPLVVFWVDKYEYIICSCLPLATEWLFGTHFHPRIFAVPTFGQTNDWTNTLLDKTRLDKLTFGQMNDWTNRYHLKNSIKTIDLIKN